MTPLHQRRREVRQMFSGTGDVAGNTLLVWSRPESPGAALNALHLFFALGAICLLRGAML